MISAARLHSITARLHSITVRLHSITWVKIDLERIIKKYILQIISINSVQVLLFI